VVFMSEFCIFLEICLSEMGMGVLFLSVYIVMIIRWFDDLNSPLFLSRSETLIRFRGSGVRYYKYLSYKY
jgi:hypothetical protein